MDGSPPDSSVHGILKGKNSGVGCHALLQGIFPAQGLDLGLLHLLHWQEGSLSLEPPGKQIRECFRNEKRESAGGMKGLFKNKSYQDGRNRKKCFGEPSESSKEPQRVGEVAGGLGEN